MPRRPPRDRESLDNLLRIVREGLMEIPEEVVQELANERRLEVAMETAEAMREMSASEDEVIDDVLSEATLHPELREFSNNLILYSKKAIMDANLLHGYNYSFNCFAVNFLRRQRGLSEPPDSVFEKTRFVSVWVKQTPGGSENLEGAERPSNGTPNIDIYDFIDDFEDNRGNVGMHNFIQEYNGQITLDWLCRLSRMNTSDFSLEVNGTTVNDIINRHLLMTMGFQRYSPVFGEFRMVYVNTPLVNDLFPDEPDRVKEIMMGIAASRATQSIYESFAGDSSLPKYFLFSGESDDPLSYFYVNVFTKVDEERTASSMRSDITIRPYVGSAERLSRRLENFYRVATTFMRQHREETTGRRRRQSSSRRR